MRGRESSERAQLRQEIASRPTYRELLNGLSQLDETILEKFTERNIWFTVQLAANIGELPDVVRPSLFSLAKRTLIDQIKEADYDEAWRPNDRTHRMIELKNLLNDHAIRLK